MHCFGHSQTHGVKVTVTAGSWRVWYSLFACPYLSVCVLYIQFCPHFQVSLIIYLHSSIFLDWGQSTRANRKRQHLTIRINSGLFRMRTPVETLLNGTEYVLFWHVMSWNMLEVRKSEELLSSALHRNALRMFVSEWHLGFGAIDFLVYSLEWI